MIYFGLALISLLTAVLLTARIHIQIISDKDLTVKLKYILLKINLTDLIKKGGQSNKPMPISPIQIIKIITKALNLTTVKIESASVAVSKEDTQDTYNRVGVIFALLYPALVALRASANEVQLNEGAINLEPLPGRENSTKYNFSIVLSAPLFSAFRLLFCYLRESIIHKRRKSKWKTR